MQEAEKLQAPKEIKERLIKEIRRFILQLSNGTQLPIPEKKYTSVKNELTHFFSSKSTTP